MTKRSVKVGDIALVPAGENFVPAKVLYLSSYFSDVILLGLYDTKQTSPDMPTELPGDFKETVYTSQVPILKKRWLLVGHEPLRLPQTAVAKRIVGGDIWLDDQDLGPASDSDMRTLPRMQVLGAALVEKKAARI